MIAIKEVQPLNNYQIHLLFEDGTKGALDLSHLVDKGVFAFWNNYDNFKKVYIDEESGAIAWNEHIDIDPLAAYLEIKGMTFEQLQVPA